MEKLTKFQKDLIIDLVIGKSIHEIESNNIKKARILYDQWHLNTVNENAITIQELQDCYKYDDFLKEIIEMVIDDQTP